MRKILLAASFLFGSAVSAFAVCPTPLTGKDAAGTTQNLSTTDDAAGSCAANIVLLDASGTNKGAINGSGQLGIIGPVTQSGTWNITNISGTVSLPTGAATSALQTTINTTLGSPFQAGGSIGNTSFAATQATSSNLKAQVDPLTAASWGIGTATQNSASATNGQLGLAQFNTTPTPITSGNMSPLQLDNAGNLLVNIKAGASSGAVAQGSTTSGQTGGLTQAAVTTSAPSYTTAQTSPLSLDTAGNLRVVGTGVAQGSTTSGQTGSPVMMGTTTAPRTDTTAQTNLLSGNTSGQLRTVGTSYPDGATPITATATGTTGATTATLAASGSLKTYICWMSIRANANAAATANSTVTGTVTGTLNFTQWTAPNASGIGLTEMIFNPCIPSSTTNTAIAVISGAPGTGGVVSVSAGGYQAL